MSNLITSVTVRATELVRNYLSSMTDILIDNALDKEPVDLSFETNVLNTLLKTVNGSVSTDDVIHLFKDGMTMMIVGNVMEEVEELVGKNIPFVITIIDEDGGILYAIPGKDVNY